MTESEWVSDAANLFLWVNFFLMSQGYTRIVGAMVMVGDGWFQNLKVAVRKRIEEFEPIARSRAGEITFSLVTSDSLQ